MRESGQFSNNRKPRAKTTERFFSVVTGTCLVTFLLLISGVVKAEHNIDPPKGRIAISADGNAHDPDDWLATPLALAMIDAAGLSDRLVHLDYANELGPPNKKSKLKRIHQAVRGGVERFGFSRDIAFNDQTQLDKSLANLAQAINESTAKDPLWIIAQGPMETVWRGLDQAKAGKRQHVHVVSHSDWNNNHTHPPETTHTWDDLKADFEAEGVTFHRIRDQNSARQSDNMDRDMNSPKKHWHWLRDADREDWRWLYRQNAKQQFDASDAGMTYWWLTGGPNGGDQQGGPDKVKHLLTNPVRQE